jgi:hypothetical protein
VRAGAASAQREETGSAPSIDEIEMLERALAPARGELGSGPFDEGRRLRLGEAIALALGED